MTGAVDEDWSVEGTIILPTFAAFSKLIQFLEQVLQIQLRQIMDSPWIVDQLEISFRSCQNLVCQKEENSFHLLLDRKCFILLDEFWY